MVYRRDPWGFPFNGFDVRVHRGKSELDMDQGTLLFDSQMLSLNEDSHQGPPQAFQRRVIPPGFRSSTENSEDTVKLQEDLDHLGCWARSWSMRFQPVKRNIMQITRKQIKKINASYTLEGSVLDNVEKVKYLSIIITNNLKWNTHVNNICTQASRTLGFLRRNLVACPKNVKESAYKGLVHSVLEYGSSVSNL